MTRIAVTTDRYREAAARYKAAGLDPVPLPCIRVEASGDEVLTRAREAAAGADLLLVSSVRTVEYLWPRPPMPAVDVAAVGTSTMAAIEARGGRVVASGRSGMADLLDLMSDRLTSSRVVFPHSTNSNPVALQTLRVRTMGRLEEFDVYQTTSVAPESTPVEAVVFASPSAVEGWLLSRDFDGLVVGAIGPTTRSSVSEIRQPDVVAPRPTHAALATVMASFLEVSV